MFKGILIVGRQSALRDLREREPSVSALILLRGFEVDLTVDINGTRLKGFLESLGCLESHDVRRQEGGWLFVEKPGFRRSPRYGVQPARAGER